MKKYINKKSALMISLFVFVITVLFFAFGQSRANPIFVAPPTFQADPWVPGTIINPSGTWIAVPSLTANNRTMRVYCLEVDVPFCHGDTYTKGTQNNNRGLNAILRSPEAYHGVSIATTAEQESVWVTQMAIWYYLDRDRMVEIEMPEGSGFFPYSEETLAASRASRPDLWARVDSLVATGNSAIDPTTNMNVSFNMNQEFTLSSDGNFFESNLVTVTASPSDIFLNYRLELTGAPSGTVVVNAQNVPVTNLNNIPAGTQFRIRVPINSVTHSNRNFVVNLRGAFTDYRAWNYFGAVECQSVVLVEPIEVLRETSRNATIPLGSLAISKTDATTGTPLAGAVIRVRRVHTGEIIETFTSTTSPRVINNLLYGEYAIEEVSAPSGFIKSTTIRNATVNRLNVPVNVPNTPIGINILKRDLTTGQPVAGARLEVLNSNRQVVFEFTSTTNAIPIPNLELGRYIVREVEAPPGYLLNTQEVPFTITEETATQTVFFDNQRNQITIEKRDLSNSNILSGAELRLTNITTGVVIDTWTSGTSGRVFTGLLPGTYLIEELAAPAGFVTAGTTEQFSITRTETTNRTIAVYNTRRQMAISKVDAETGLLVAGAILRVEQMNGNVVVPAFTTTTTPTTITQTLPAGIYRVVEVSPPPGYTINNTPQQIVIEEGSSNIMVNFPNTRNSISLAKVDSTTSNPVSGATLRLVDQQGRVVETWTSTLTAHVIRGLPAGTYYFEEVDAPNGYIRNTERIPIVVTESTTSATYTMQNVPIDVSIAKIDSVTRQPLAGAQLELLDSSRNIVDTWTSTTTPHRLRNITEGTFFLRETTTIHGYVLNTEEVRITINENRPVQLIEFENEPIRINLGKIDANTGRYLAGATLRLTSADPSFEPVTWVSTDQPKQMERIRPGIYILEELQAPPGYITSNSRVVFEVRNTGVIQNLHLESEYLDITVKNRRLHIDTHGVADFGFMLTNSDGRVINEWKTTEEIYISEELDLGDFILTNTAVPEGKVRNNTPWRFTVSDSDDITHVRFGNDFTRVLISKLDITNAEELPGAHLIIHDQNNNVVEEWISTDTPHLIERLPVGRYRLTETIAPPGYELSTEIIYFEVLETGNIQRTHMYNRPQVPNTFAGLPVIVYIMGTVLVFAGGVLISINMIKNKSRKVEK